MGKTYSIPGEGLLPDPNWGKAKAMRLNPKPHAHSYAQPVPDSIGHHLSGDLEIAGIGSMWEAFLALKERVDLLTDAIEAAHKRGDDGKCVEGCWSCRVEEAMRSIKVAKRIGGV